MRTLAPTLTNRILRSAMSRRGKLGDVPSSSAAWSTVSSLSVALGMSVTPSREVLSVGYRGCPESAQGGLRSGWLYGARVATVAGGCGCAFSGPLLGDLGDTESAERVGAGRECGYGCADPVRCLAQESR